MNLSALDGGGVRLEPVRGLIRRPVVGGVAASADGGHGDDDRGHGEGQGQQGGQQKLHNVLSRGRTARYSYVRARASSGLIRRFTAPVSRKFPSGNIARLSLLKVATGGVVWGQRNTW